MTRKADRLDNWIRGNFVAINSELEELYFNSENPEVVEAMGEDLGTLDSVNLLGANLNWSDVGGLPLDLALFGTNLTDEEYYGFVPGLGANGLETANLGQPRTYGIRLRYRFGADDS